MATLPILAILPTLATFATLESLAPLLVGVMSFIGPDAVLIFQALDC